MAGGTQNEGRVTTRELYNALQEQNKERADMERRITVKLDDVCDSVSRHDERIKKNEEEVKILRGRSNWFDLGLGAFTVFVAGLSEIWRRNG